MSEIKKRSFEYTRQETYSQGELENILNQHAAFVGGATKKELEALSAENNTLKTANKEYSTKEKARTVKKLAKEISPEGYEKLVKYTKLSEDATEEEIKKALGETHKDFSPAPVDTSTPKVESTKKVEEKPKEEEEDKFDGL